MDGHARLALIGRLLPAAVHELNNPLTTISGFAQLLAASTDDPRIRADLAQIEAASTTASRYVAGLMRLMGRAREVSIADLSQTLDEALSLLGYELRRGGIAVETRKTDRPLPIAAPVGLLLEAVLHLLVDRLDRLEGAAPAGEPSRARPDAGDAGAGRRRLLVATEAADGGGVLVAVGDSGVAGDASGSRTPDDDRAAVPASGWFGLDRCREIAEALGGALEVDAAGGAAAVARAIRLRIPLVGADGQPTAGGGAARPEGAAAPPDLAAGARTQLENAPGGGGRPPVSAGRGESPQGAAPAVGPPASVAGAEVPLRVLVADDDPGIRYVLAELLRSDGLVVETAGSADEALAEALRTRPDRLLVDIRMPGGGRALWEGLSAADADLAGRVVFVTGDSGDDGTRAFLEATGGRLVRKPFRIEELRAALGLGGSRTR